MADLDLTIDWSNRKVTGGIADAAAFVIEDKLNVSLKFTKKDGDQDVDYDPPIRTLKASIGSTLAAPTSGLFSLRSHTLAAVQVDIANIAFNTSASAMLTALSGLDWVTAVSSPVTGTWVITSSKTDQQSAPPDISKTLNTLDPVSFIRIRSYMEEGFWQFEIRLIVAPVAFTDSFQRILPAAPTIQRLQAGGSTSTTDDIIVNEIQSLTVPANFSANFTIGFDLRVSAILTVNSTVDDIAAALNGMYGDGKVRFAVTNPQPNQAFIEFIGPLQDSSQNLMTITASGATPGVVNFQLDLGKAAMCDALRATDNITLPMEIEVMVVDDGKDPTDMDNVARPVTVMQQPVKIVPGQITPEVSTEVEIDWQEPPYPDSYIPFDRSQTITGQQNYATTDFGNGSATTFVFDHNLGTMDISGYALLENKTDAKLFALGRDYNVVINSENRCTLTLLPVRTFGTLPAGIATPAHGDLRFILTTAGPVTRFVEDVMVTESQVTGLISDLTTIADRLTSLETKMPTTPPTVAAGGSGAGFSMTLEYAVGLIPGRWPSGFDPQAAFSTGTGLNSRGLGLLTAFHVADGDVLNATGITTSPFDAPSAHANKVIKNNTGSNLTIPGGLGRKSAIVANNGYFASDGRTWYAVNKQGTTKSYFPADFEIQLGTFIITNKMLRAGQTLKFEFDLGVALKNADTNAQWVLVIEHGAITSDTSPIATATNLAAINWNTTPILTQQLVFGNEMVSAKFGASVTSDAAGTTITTNALYFGQYEAGASAPAAAQFAMRARLVQFDTLDADADTSRGWAYYKFTGATINAQ